MMSSHGRGRGMRRNFEGNEKPGGLKNNTRAVEESARNEDYRQHKTDDSPIPDAFNTSDLIELVDKMDIEKAEDKKTEQVRRITKCMKYLCNSEESLKSVIDEMHQKSLDTEDFGRKAARAFGNVSQLEVMGVKLRDVVLRCIQTDFKRKEEILAQNETKFLNSVNLLCEVFEHMRLADGTVINVLAVPILEYCDILISTPSPQTVNLLGRQLQVIGEEVQRSKPDKFTDFLLKIRQMIISPPAQLSLESRCILLHILESHLLRWPTLLPEKTGEWYASIIGERVLMRKPALAPQSHATKVNGHARNKEEGLTAEDELVLQRVIGANDYQNVPNIPHSPNYNTAYYESQPPRPRSNPSSAPRVYNTPPPNMLPGSFNMQPPRMTGNMNPNLSSENRPIRGQDPRPHMDPRRGPPPTGDMGNLNGVERLAVDMMAFGMPSQVSPTGRDNRSTGWQNMPPNIPAPLSGQLPGPRIPTAIVPPGVPPHIRHPNASQWGGEGQPQRPRSNPSSGNNNQGWNTMPPPGRGDPHGRGDAMPLMSSHGRGDGPPPMPSHGRGDGPPQMQHHGIPHGRGEPHHGRGEPYHGRGDQHHGRGDQHHGRGEQHQGRGDSHRAGSGRIMPNTTPPPETGTWNTPNSGPNSWNGSQRGSVNKETRSGFDIGTWENPGGNTSSDSEQKSSGWEKQKSGAWDDEIDTWSGGDNKQWSNNDGSSQMNDNKWSSNDGGGPSNESQWSNNDGASSTNDNKWSSNDGSASASWSTNDCKEDSSFGTWENPKNANTKPARNEEVRSWGNTENNAMGNWGKEGQVTPTKNEWANNSTGSVEISPGSAWKKEPSMVGNWADELQSPRGDSEENPLDISLKEARKSLSNW